MTQFSHWGFVAQSVSRVDPDADLLLELLEGHLGALALRGRPLAVDVDRRAPDVRLEDDDGQGQQHEVQAAKAVLGRGGGPSTDVVRQQNHVGSVVLGRRGWSC